MTKKSVTEIRGGLLFYKNRRENPVALWVGQLTGQIETTELRDLSIQVFHFRPVLLIPT